MLKLKSKIYQYTGIYLAQKEELDFLQSKEFWQQFEAFSRKNEPLNHVQGLILGSWQSKNGFYRITTKHSFSTSLKGKTFNFVSSAYSQANMDIRHLYSIIAKSLK